MIQRLTNAQAREMARKAIIIWVEGHAPSIFRKSGDAGDHMDAEQELLTILRQLVDRSIEECGLMAYYRTYFLAFASSRLGSEFLRQYTYLDHKGRKNGVTPIMRMQCRRIQSKLIELIEDNLRIAYLLPLYYQKQAERKKKYPGYQGGILSA
jgi:hypothetical protein